MKKVLTLLIVIFLSCPCAFAKENKFTQLKNTWDKIVGAEKKNPLVEVDPDAPLTASQQAMIYYNNNEAQKAYDTLLQIPEGEKTAQDWVLLGNLLQDQEKTSDAVFMYQRAITANPEFYKSYYNLGNIYLMDEKPFLAIENYRKANKANPEFSYGYYNLGCAYLKTGNLQKAKIAFLKAIELKNNEPDFHYNLAYTYKKLGKDKLAKQYLGFYNKALTAKE